jgi:ubiquinol-cytochrome c reductase cytochrome b subunit
MLMWHILLLPLIVVVVIGIHVLLVRKRGVVPPFADNAGAENAFEETS